SQLVRGYTETLNSAYMHAVSFSCQPAEPWRVLVLDDADYGRADSDYSTLDSAVTATATTLSVAVEAGRALWTIDPADFPLDVEVAGERITVTGITGATSPQAFTVTRSVNGVATAHPAGVRVGLADPVYLGK